LKEIIQKTKELFQYFRSFRFWILLVGITGGTLGLAYAHFFREVEYTSKLTFAIEEKGGGGGSLAGIASQFGFDLGGVVGGGSVGLFTSDNLLLLLKSNRIIQGALLKPVPELEEGNLLNHYLKIHFQKELNKNEISLIDSRTIRSEFTRDQDSVVAFVAENLSKEVEIVKRDKKASLIDITIIDPSEKFAFLFNQFLIQEATDLYIELKVGKMRRSVKLLQSRVDSVHRVLDGTMRSAAMAMDQSLGIVSLAPRVSTTKKQLENQMLGTLFGELTKNLELTKFTLEREEPVIQIVDAPMMPLLKEGKGRVKFAVIGVFLATFLMLGYLFGKRYLEGL
jgi:hypothetical protein